MKKRIFAALMAVMMTVGLFGCSSDQKTAKEFTPSLDTEASVQLDTMGFFGNFEALDQVTNDFNQYYPNVTFNYEQVGGDSLVDYLNSNPDADIFMISDKVKKEFEAQLESYCADLGAEKIDVSAIDKDMLNTSYLNDQLVSIPIGQNMYGMVVNVDLLKKEGLEVPDTYDEFLDALETLKQKGYVPIQGSVHNVYAEMTENIMYNLVENDEDFYKALCNGEEAAVEKLTPVFEKLNTIIENGYTDYELNQSYPEDNYDEAILRFFEGDVPFWVCNTEKVSGMKKRETKSEAYTADPFEYTFIYAPMGEKGVYAAHEPWYGFCVNKNSAEYDYAVEFLRFLATKDEINQMADIKGVPSVAVEASDNDLYANVRDPKKVEMSCIRDEKLTWSMIDNWYTCANHLASGELASPEAAAEEFVTLCQSN